MTWPLRLAALGCLVGACTPVGPLVTLGFILLALSLFVASLHGRAPWCWCGHGKTVHTHDRDGTDCSLCTCKQYTAPLIWRKHAQRN